VLEYQAVRTHGQVDRLDEGMYGAYDGKSLYVAYDLNWWIVPGVRMIHQPPKEIIRSRVGSYGTHVCYVYTSELNGRYICSVESTLIMRNEAVHH
jgi:hypothetical protein